MRLIAILITTLLAVNNCPAKPLDRVAILERAIAVAPEVETAKASLSEAAANIISAKVTPQPELEFEMEEVGIDRPGISDSEMAVTWSRDIEPKRRRRLRINVAKAEGNVNKAQLRTELLVYLYEVTEAFYEVAAKDLKLQLAKEQEKLAQDLLDVAKKRVRAGATPGLEEERASIEHAATKIDTESARLTLDAARKRLAEFLNWNPNKLGSLETSAIDERSVPSAKKAKEKMQLFHPELLASKEELFAQGLSIDLARNEQLTTWRTMAGVQHFTGNSEQALVLGISVPLGNRKRNKGALLAAKAREKRVKHELQVLGRSLERKLNLALATAHRAQSILKSIDSTILPRAEAVFSAVKEGYLRGELSYADLLEARRALVGASKKRVAALIEFREAHIEVEKACGGTESLHTLVEEVLQ